MRYYRRLYWGEDLKKKKEKDYKKTEYGKTSKRYLCTGIAGTWVESA